MSKNLGDKLLRLGTEPANSEVCMLDLLEQCYHGRFLKRQVTSQQHKKNNSAAPNISLLAVVALIGDNFGSNIIRCSACCLWHVVFGHHLRRYHPPSVLKHRNQYFSNFHLRPAEDSRA